MVEIEFLFVVLGRDAAGRAVLVADARDEHGLPGLPLVADRPGGGPRCAGPERLRVGASSDADVVLMRMATTAPGCGHFDGRRLSAAHSIKNVNASPVSSAK